MERQASMAKKNERPLRRGAIRRNDGTPRPEWKPEPLTGTSYAAASAQPASTSGKDK